MDPKTYHLGTTKNSINDRFNSREKRRIALAISNLANNTTKLKHAASSLAYTTLTIAADEFLRLHGKLIHPNGPPTMIGGLRVDLALPRFPGPIQLIPFAAAPLPISTTKHSTIKVPSLDLSRSNFFYKCLTSCAYDNIPSANPLNIDFHSIYFSAFRGAMTQDPPAFGTPCPNVPGNEWVKINLDDFQKTRRKTRKDRTLSEFFNLLAGDLLADFLSTTVSTFQLHLNAVIKDIILNLSAGSRVERELTARATIFFSPVFIKDFQFAHLLHTRHPMFRYEDNSGYMPLAVRRAAVRKFSSLFALLVYILEPSNFRVQSLPPPSLVHMTSAEMLQHYSKFTTWREVLKGNAELAPRTLPFIRMSQRIRYREHDLKPHRKGELPGSLLSCFKTRYEPENIYLDSLSFMGCIISELTFDRENIARIQMSKLLVAVSDVSLISTVYNFFWLILYRNRMQK